MLVLKGDDRLASEVRELELGGLDFRSSVLKEAFAELDVLFVDHSDLVRQILDHGRLFELLGVRAVIFPEQFTVLLELLLVHFLQLIDQFLTQFVDILHFGQVVADSDSLHDFLNQVGEVFAVMLVLLLQLLEFILEVTHSGWVFIEGLQPIPDLSLELAAQFELVITVGVRDLIVFAVNDHWDILKHNRKVVLIHILKSRLVFLLFLELFEADEEDDGENREYEVEEIEYALSFHMFAPLEVVP